MLNLPSFEPAYPRKVKHSLCYNGPVAQDSSHILLISVLGCFVIVYAFTVVTAGSWSLLHQWAGYTVLINSIALFAVFKLNRQPVIEASHLQRDTGANAAVWALPLLMQKRMHMALMILIGIAVLSGWMCTLDFFWGQLWIEDAHSVAAYAATSLMFVYGAVMLYLKIRQMLQDRCR